MAKDSTPGGSASKPGSQRKPVTIDLPAEEVARRQEKSSAEGQTESSAAAHPSSETAKPPKESGKDTRSGSVNRKQPEESVIPSALAPSARTGGGAEDAAGRGPRSSATTPSFVSLAAAALTGGVVVALVVVVLALAGLFRPMEEVTEGPDVADEVATLRNEIAELRESALDDQVAPLREQLAALEQAIAAVQDAPVGSQPSEEGLQALRESVSELEASVARISAGTASADAGEAFAARLEDFAGEIDELRRVRAPDISGLENSVAELRQEIGALATDVGNLPPAERIAAVERKLDDVAQQMAVTSALGPAVAAGALAAAIEAGQPFTNELGALRSLGVDAEAIAALEPYAEPGLPTLSEIRAQFETEVGAVDLAPPITEGTGPLDRLLQSARGLVEVRPANPTAGADPAAIITRIRAALAAGNLTTALTEWASLPDEIKAETEDWADLLETRIAADALVARLRNEALSRLGSEG